ncbi:MAG: hemolysin III family protein [Winogradskyella sp.]|uniref:PAQR family membrane homeostasis protein TrhA n=1 Tax=Winogradskyella sp. TaxID=1883156 RepID=UPI00385C2259
MRIQTKREEQLNTLTHGFGALLGIIALVLLIFKVDDSTPWSLFSVVVYGLSIIILFFASTFYHAVEGEKRKHYFRIVDHVSIYLLIAGTYTPVLLILLTNSLGWELFWSVWGIAVFGVILKLFFTGKFEIFSTLLYLVMGWLIVLDFSNASNALGTDGVLWLFAGGLFYTVGIVFYSIQKIPYNHVIWHLFVLAGAMCHFFMIYLHVIQPICKK